MTRDSSSPNHEIGTGELGADERAFLDQAKVALSPSDEALKRLKYRLEGALVAPPNLELLPSRTSAPSRWTRTLGLGLFGLGLGIGVTGGYFWGLHNERMTQLGTQPAAFLPPGPGTIAGIDFEPAVHDQVFAPANSGAKTVSPPSADDRTVAAKRQVPNKPDAATPTESDEILMVQRVQRALARREVGLATALLAELDATLPNGRLLEERSAGKCIASCIQGKNLAHATCAKFKTRYPQSVHLARINSTCSPSKSNSK